MGLKLDKCDKTGSLSSEGQYVSYCHELVLWPRCSRAGERRGSGIGGEVKMLGTVKRKIPFKYIIVIIYVNILVIKLRVRAILSLSYMVDNSLGISLQNFHVSLEENKHNLAIKNFFFVPNCKK